MKKKLLLIVMLFMVMLLTGCGSKDKVVIYTSMEEERNQKLTEMLKEEFPNLNVVVQHMATGNSAAKIKMRVLMLKLILLLIWKQLI